MHLRRVQLGEKMQDSYITLRTTPEVRQVLQQLKSRATPKIVYNTHTGVTLQDWRAVGTPTIATFANYDKAEADAEWIANITSAAPHLLSDAESLEQALAEISELKEKLNRISSVYPETENF